MTPSRFHHMDFPDCLKLCLFLMAKTLNSPWDWNRKDVYPLGMACCAGRLMNLWGERLIGHTNVYIWRVRGITILPRRHRCFVHQRTGLTFWNCWGPPCLRIVIVKGRALQRAVSAKASSVEGEEEETFKGPAVIPYCRTVSKLTGRQLNRAGERIEQCSAPPPPQK